MTRKKNINTILKDYFDVEKEEKEIKARKAELQTQIDNYAVDHVKDFVDDTIVLDKGIIKMQAGRAKIVIVDTEKALTTVQRQNLRRTGRKIHF